MLAGVHAGPLTVRWPSYSLSVAAACSQIPGGATIHDLWNHHQSACLTGDCLHRELDLNFIIDEDGYAMLLLLL